MVAVSTNDLKNNMTIKVDDELFSVVFFQHVKPGKGGAFVRTKLKSLKTGAVLEKTFRADEKLEQVILEKTEAQLLYKEGDNYVFMKLSDYEQVIISSTLLGDQTQYLKEGSEVHLLLDGANVVGVELPTAVELEVIHTEAGVQGDRVSGARKAATLQTGLVIQVPLFVNTGDIVKVDTRTGEYLSRA
jgi:elongation factor P